MSQMKLTKDEIDARFHLHKRMYDVWSYLNDREITRHIIDHLKGISPELDEGQARRVMAGRISPKDEGMVSRFECLIENLKND